MKRLTRVCYVIPSLSMGGTEGQLIRLIEGLVRDHEVTVVCTHHDGALAGEARRCAAYVRVLGCRGGWDPTLGLRLRKVFRSHKPDVLHTFLFGFDLLANRAARHAGVPVVVSSRRQLATWRKRRHVEFQRLGNRLVDAIVANSRAVVDFAIEHEGVDRALFRVIPNGIDADDFVSGKDLRQIRLRYRIPFNRRVVGIVANFSPVKDHHLFVDTARELLRRRADLHFLMVGHGPLVPAIERHIVRSRMPQDCFSRISTVSELADLYGVMDCSVLCSKAEGFPNAVIESMAAGTPVVAPAVGGIVELVRHEQTGRLVSSREPEDFADAVEWVLDHDGESEAMARRAAQFVRAELTLDNMVKAYRALYAELLAKAPGQAISRKM